MRSLFILLALLATVSGCLAAPDRSRITITLSAEQIFEFDQTGWITLTKAQQAEVSMRSGFSPSRVQPVYSEPDGEVGELGYNLALRTKDNEVEIYRRYLKTDEQVKVKIQDNRRMIGAMTHSTKEYPSYIIDADGKYWKFLSRGEFVDEVKRAKKRIGEVYIHMPTSLLDMDTVASRDGLRQVKAVLREFDLPSHEITEK
jgi:hypothetical protein